MANILISSLGTGNKNDGGYKKAKYKYNDKIDETTFISKALCKFLDIDKLFIVGTKGSIWDSCYKEFGGEDENIELELYEKIENKEITNNDLSVINKAINNNLDKLGSKCYLIDYGLNENELWNNFDKYLDILESIEDGDTVYIDISHAFRSLALMSFLMVQFGHGVKNKKFKIGGIFYGMLEYSRENNGITPIVDLKVFYDLMEWIKAIDAFKNYGHADLLVKMFENENNVKSQTKETFNKFDINLSMANMSALKKFVVNAVRILPILKQSNNKIVKLISPDIEYFIKKINKQKTSEFQLELAIWFFENRNYALSYIVLLEALVTKECEINNLKINNKNDRNKAKNNLYESKNEIGQVYKEVSRIRNNIAHQRDMKNNQQSICEDKKVKKIDIEKEIKYLKKCYFVKIKKYFKKK